MVEFNAVLPFKLRGNLQKKIVSFLKKEKSFLLSKKEE